MYLANRRFASAATAALCVGLALDLPAAAPVGPPRERAPREMSTDRPDTTESPFTLEPGRAQLEMSFATHERDDEDGIRTTAWEAAPFNVRLGVTPAVEVGFFFTPYQRISERVEGGPEVKRDGVGDLTLRTKWNLRGNDQPDFGVGLMLDVTLPTAPRSFGRRKAEAALTVPTAFELGAGWSGGAMTSLQAARTETGARRPLWLNTLAVGRDLVGELGGFVELASFSGHGAHVLTFNCGLTHAVNPDLQLDAGVNIGVSRSAPDTLWFAGMSRRF